MWPWPTPWSSFPISITFFWVTPWPSLISTSPFILTAIAMVLCILFPRWTPGTTTWWSIPPSPHRAWRFGFPLFRFLFSSSRWTWWLGWMSPRIFLSCRVLTSRTPWGLVGPRMAGWRAWTPLLLDSRHFVFWSFVFRFTFRFTWAWIWFGFLLLLFLLLFFLYFLLFGWKDKNKFEPFECQEIFHDLISHFE